MASMGAHDQSSKYLQVSIPDYNFSSETHVTSLHSENTSLSSKMKRMLASPKVSRGKAAPNPNKTFGVPLEHLTDRDKAEVPVIVSRICEFLRAQGFKQEGLFRVNGNMKVVDRLKNSFDKCGDANLEEIGDVPAAASLLKMFLREMADPVIPEDLQPIFIQVQDQFCKQKDKAVPLIKELIRRMPKDNAYLLKYLCEFMLAIADGSDVNKMTPLALAIVFGPNIFRCGEGLDGLRDQAYVNAVLLLILQEYEEMFLIDNNKFPDSKPRVAPEKPTAYFDAKKAKTEETNKTAPARPPPPRLGLEQEIPVPFEKSPKRSSTKSPRRSSRRKSPKSPRQEPPIKQRSASKKKSKKEAERSASPTFSHLSSPLSKQLLVSTISTTVKEHLFGPDMLISSTESESHDDRIQERSAENSQNIENEDAEQNSVYPSVKERVKKFSVSSEPGNTPSKNLKSNKPNDQRKPSFSRSFSSLSADMKNEISDTDLDFIKVSSQNTLEHLTTKRAQPPSNRRRPTSYVRCEDDNTRQSKGQPSRPSATRSNNSNADCETIYSDKVIPRTHEARDSSSHSRSNRRTMNQRDADAAINSFEKLNILQMQDEDRGTESYKVSRSFVKNSNDNEEKLAFNSGPPSPSENRKQMWKEKRQDNVLIVEMTPQELKKRITALKMTISNFEADFMAAHGRKPKPSEKTQIQKYIAELGRAKKQHKELMNDYKDQPELLMDTEPMGLDLGTAPNFREIMHRDAEPTKEQTLSNLLKRLEEKRSATGRPHEILAMSPEQLTDEKLAVQKSLLQYENQHGRPSSKEDKTLMRPIYDRYRKIKRLIAAYKMDDTGYENENETIYDTPRSGRTYDASFESSRDETLGSNRHISKTTTPRDLISSPTAEYYTIVTVDDGNPEDYLGSGTGGEDSTLLSDTFSVTNRLPYTPEAFSPQPESSNNGFEESVLHEASLNELLDQLKDTKNAKKRLGKILKDFEDNFFATNDRKVQKEDRLPREAEYREYKLIKAKLRLVEALIAKKKRSTESM